MIAFPHRAVAPDGTEHQPVKVFETGGEVRVVAHEQGRAVLLAHAAGSLERRKVEGSRNTVLVLATEAGEWEITAARGCGCSHPLKRFSEQQAKALEMVEA